METMSPSAWLWIVLVSSLVALAAGYALALQKFFWLWPWESPCPAACNCPGPPIGAGGCPHMAGHAATGCTAPGCAAGLVVGKGAHTHHVPAPVGGVPVGTCTRALGHAGSHSCSGGHTF